MISGSLPRKWLRLAGSTNHIQPSSYSLLLAKPPLKHGQYFYVLLSPLCAYERVRVCESLLLSLDTSDD
nr:MAG TPA: hypothetical protein [Caudoviricetes sp.]